MDAILPNLSGSLLLLVIPLVVLLHFLKFRPRKVVVPSVRLWKEAANDPIANAPWQRLKHWRELVTQLIAVLAISLAAMGLQIPDSMRDTQTRMLVVDVTPSMLMQDESGVSLLDLARREMIKELDAAGPEDRFGISTFDGSIDLIAPLGSPISQLKEQLETLKISNRSDSAQERLRALRQLQDRLGKGASLVFYTSPTNDEEVRAWPATVGVRALGTPIANRGITAAAFDLQRDFDDSSIVILASVIHEGEVEDTPLLLEEERSGRWHSIDARSSKQGVMRFQVPRPTTASARFRLRFEIGDQLPADDQVVLRWEKPLEFLPQIQGSEESVADILQAAVAFGASADTKDSTPGTLTLREPWPAGIEASTSEPIEGGITYFPDESWEGVGLPEVLEAQAIPLSIDENIWKPLIYLNEHVVAARRIGAGTPPDMVLSIAIKDATNETISAFAASDAFPILMGSWYFRNVAHSGGRLSGPEPGAMLLTAESRQVASGVAMEVEGRRASTAHESAYSLAPWLIALALIMVLWDWYWYRKRIQPARAA